MSGANSNSGLGAQYCFSAEWWDAAASIVRKYHLLYFTLDDSIEMFDVKNRRTFLKRVVYPSVRLVDLYPGAQISVYARQLKIIDFADEFTRTTLGAVKTKSLALLKPVSVHAVGPILDAVTSNGLTISRLVSVQLSQVQAQEFFGDASSSSSSSSTTPSRASSFSSSSSSFNLSSSSSLSSRVNELSSGPIVAIELVGQNAQEVLLKLGSSNHSLSNVLVSTSARSAELETDFFFSNRTLQTTAQLRNCTTCVIKPHALEQAGAIISFISSSPLFSISALELFHLDREAATEFLEVYKGVIPEYHHVIEQLTSGPCIALEIRLRRESSPPSSASSSSRSSSSSSSSSTSSTSSSPSDVVSLFREFAGPSDPEIARKLRPNTIRAKFGHSKVKNAVHCTDLSEDGVLEAEFFFQMLHNSRIH